MKHRQPHPRYLARPSYMNESVEGLALDRVAEQETTTMPTSVAGLRIDDRLAAVAMTAIEQGWRAEPADDGKGLTLYGPDPSTKPVRIGTARVTPKHIANFKSELKRSGVLFDPTIATAASGIKIRNDDGPAPEGAMGLHEAIAKCEPEHRVDFAGTIVDAIGQSLGMPEQLAELATVAFLSVNRWYERGRLDVLMGDLAKADLEVTELCDTLMQERDAAVAERDALQVRLERADEKAHAAAKDCGEALDRARDAEARAEKAESDLATIRRLLGTEK